LTLVHFKKKSDKSRLIILKFLMKTKEKLILSNLR
jgi:hypothetical protein